MTSPRAIRVLLADDHPLVLEGVKSFIETFDHIEVVGTATNGNQALEKFDATRPDVVVMDLNMPELNGLTATEIMLERNPEAKVLILSMHNSLEYITTAVRHGAQGYILKDVPTEEIVTAIETIYAGNKYFCESTEQLLQPGKTDSRELLTSREQTILLQLASGKSNKEVARDLEISPRTVETHRQNIKRKLGISSAAGLTRYAIEHGVLQNV